MVEKTRRSLTVLRRCQEADREEMNHWIRRYSDVEEMKKGGSNGQHCLPPPPLPPPPTPHHNSSSNTASSSEALPVGTSSAAERQTGRQTGRGTHTGDVWQIKTLTASPVGLIWNAGNAVMYQFRRKKSYFFSTDLHIFAQTVSEYKSSCNILHL